MIASIKVGYASLPISESDTCDLCGATIRHLVIVVDHTGTSHTYGSECGPKMIGHWSDKAREANDDAKRVAEGSLTDQYQQWLKRQGSRRGRVSCF